ncbi:hypothetical protein Ctaglu_08940 [Clostridium tagluense]|uniref:Uncharacterized protein n=1 Tax=Clostridium tagluense TaxID=360422 RepID=A0A401UI82_9CLOT|nr:hypothetical protein Ctaglu_08940 [Clostridium tagluense]
MRVPKCQKNIGQNNNIKLIAIKNKPNFVLCLINPIVQSIPPIIANIDGPKYNNNPSKAVD